jgi:succinate dehydrogenase / fumarate reductase flavoprotein subunit
LAVYLDFKDAIKNQGHDAIKAKYGTLFDLYKKVTGINPYEEPMRIYPASHYTMGGLWVDYNLMTTIPGLYALGEANFSDHGANRLGASSLMQCAGDGYFIIPVTIGDYLADQIRIPRISTDTPEFDEAEKAVIDKLNKLLSIKGSQTPTSFHKRLGHILWTYSGMKRNEEGLEKALKQVKNLKEEFWKDVKVSGGLNELNHELEKAWRIADFFDLANLIILDALNRKESCGAHFREEYQSEEGEAERDDKNYSYVAAWEYTGEISKPKLHKEELVFEFVKPTKRSYK